ncbi:hypothetical protein KB1_19340 [Cutibacterium modestum]|uniref:Uncharacterized protein n=1 Tax=Cutibacterium modestum TaxID=2559073 RepID=A0AAD1NWN7_9ACTN|nr:hypothetical protein KB1_19340 [Cutibacterium modestum]
MQQGHLPRLHEDSDIIQDKIVIVSGREIMAYFRNCDRFAANSCHLSVGGEVTRESLSTQHPRPKAKDDA